MNSPKRFIIVEDSHVTRLHLESLLCTQGYTVVSKLDRAEDLHSAVKEHQPDLILLDIMLKGTMNGIEAAKCLRANDIHTPIVFMTALTDQKSTEDIAELCNCQRVPKPFEEKLLLSTIEQAVA